ncbi:S1 RNA-binding domain-containing protein [Pseudogracilibacillus auburnensis]|uniref:S1 motif domain-containing protein n=1 Tax=Pseudogracilibacillus auburnensis TaxID=1494959 RepID=A0A2V3W4U2_9BACI|nr:S1-like domain-containing RNA-binding protein [Pseudogracilibacillus auburnensis]PXW88061.1 hypothetical protein DFR56_104213 [Pseudogracilibacillus auburnensis]
MSKLPVGTIHTMRVTERTNEGFLLTKGTMKVLVPLDEKVQNSEIGAFIDVFLYTDKKKQLLATTTLPKVVVGLYDWAEVVDVIPHLGAFIDIGIGEDILIFSEDLPLFKSVWPKQGDKIYVTLKADSNNRLLAVPATERIFADLFGFAEEIELNESVSGHVIRVDREGTVMLTGENYRGFIHHTERTKEPRFGEYITGRVIEVKEDGTLNVSLLPLKHERMADDAEKILAVLQEADGEIAFNDKSDPAEIRHTFQMSKSAFKRALGRLMKERKIEQRDGKTFLL